MRIKFLLLVSAMLFCTVTQAEDSPETVCKSAAELFADDENIIFMNPKNV